MDLTLQSLTEDFQPINFTLVVEPLGGRHIAAFTKKSLQQQLKIFFEQKMKITPIFYPRLLA